MVELCPVLYVPSTTFFFILLNDGKIGTELSHDVAKPSSRSTLMGEQAQPLEAPPPPDVERADIEVPTQIHRSGLSRYISLLSLANVPFIR